MDELDDLDLKRFFVITERFNGRFHARDIAVMVRSPHVDQLLEAAVKLVFVISDVRQKIRVGPVFLIRTRSLSSPNAVERNHVAPSSS